MVSVLSTDDELGMYARYVCVGQALSKGERPEYARVARQWQARGVQQACSL